MAEKVKCPLEDCREKPKSGTGLAAHCRSHVLRGEAIYAEDKKTLIRVPDVPIVTEAYARKLRMDAIHRGEIQAQIKLPGAKKKTTALAKHKPSAADVHIPPNPIDISKLDPTQIEQLRQALGVVPQGTMTVENHTCPTTRAMDRMKQAIVMTQVAEMFDEYTPDQLLIMMSQMTQLAPMMPLRGRNGR